MPRLTRKPPKYSLHKPSGQAKVRSGGRTVYLGKYGSPESKEAYARFIACIPKPEPVVKIAEPAPGASFLVGEIVLKFFNHAKEYYVRDGVPTGEHETIRCCLRFLTNRYLELPALEFGPKKLKIVREDMIKLGKSRQYINKATGIIKRCFRWAASEELVPGTVSVALGTVSGLQKNRTAAREKDPVGPVADEHVDAVLPHVSELVADVLRTMRLTGARPGEVLAMTAEEIDRTDPSLWVFRPAEHKCMHKGKDRAIFIGAKAQEIILPRILKTEPGGRLFPMNRTTLRELVHRGCRKAGVPNWHPNQIRHTVATEVRSKFGLEGSQVLLGHARADVTQTYAERDMRLAADIARKIG